MGDKEMMQLQHQLDQMKLNAKIYNEAVRTSALAIGVYTSSGCTGGGGGSGMGGMYTPGTIYIPAPAAPPATWTITASHPPIEDDSCMMFHMFGGAMVVTVIYPTLAITATKLRIRIGIGVPGFGSVYFGEAIDEVGSPEMIDVLKNRVRQYLTMYPAAAEYLLTK